MHILPFRLEYPFLDVIRNSIGQRFEIRVRILGLPDLQTDQERVSRISIIMSCIVPQETFDVLIKTDCRLVLLLELKVRVLNDSLLLLFCLLWRGSSIASVILLVLLGDIGLAFA